jgi:hypothetical protein
MLRRQLDVALFDASPAKLRALRDSAQLGWRLATTREDSITAATLAAQAAYTTGDNADCLRWARRAVQLGEGEGAAVLVRECQ